MRFLSIRVDAEGSREVGYRRAQRRLLAVPLALLPLGLGFLAILVNPQRRGWHDRIAGTTVVYDTVHSTAPWASLDESPHRARAAEDSAASTSSNRS